MALTCALNSGRRELPTLRGLPLSSNTIPTRFLTSCLCLVVFDRHVRFCQHWPGLQHLPHVHPAFSWPGHPHGDLRPTWKVSPYNTESNKWHTLLRFRNWHQNGLMEHLRVCRPSLNLTSIKRPTIQPAQLPLELLAMSTSFLASPYAAAFGACVFLYFIVLPVVTYFRDVNGQCTFFVNPHMPSRCAAGCPGVLCEPLANRIRSSSIPWFPPPRGLFQCTVHDSCAYWCTIRLS